MKRQFLFAATLVLLPATAFAAPTNREVGGGLCRLDGQPVVFERVGGSGSPLIQDGIARVGEGASLVFHFNPFFGIGGFVRYQSSSVNILLLRWGSEHADPISSGTIVHDGHVVECRLAW